MGDDLKSNIELAINYIKIVADRRERLNFKVEMEEIEKIVRNFKFIFRDSERENFDTLLSNIVEFLIFVIDDLRLEIDLEKRFLVVPFEEIKKQTFEFGGRFWPKFLSWLSLFDGVEVEKVLKVIDDDEYRLKVAEELLVQVKKGNKHEQSF